MANFCIMRTKKLKADSNVGASVSHALRTRETPNADENKTKQNWSCWKGNQEECRARAMAKYHKLLPAKIRKNGVRAVELLMTASPEALKNPKIKPNEYLNACDKWAKDTFGAKNIFLITHHYDETTPHTSIFLVPIDPKGKLNCRHFLGGREKLQALQDSFAEKVGKKFGMERGIRGSKAKHQTIKQFYAKAKNIDKALEPPKKGLFENQEEYQSRYKQQIAPLMKSVLSAETLKKAAETRITGLQRDLKRKTEINIELKKEVDFWRNLSPEKLIQYAESLKKENVKSLKELENKMKKEQERKKGGGWER